MAQQLVGWWLFDANRIEIVHASTGQALRYLGGPQSTAGLSHSGNRIWMRFEYRDQDISFPLLIEWRNVPSDTFGRPLVWRVDYIRSAVLWRDENARQAFPPYGVWRRVDDCLTDALACWPSHPQTGAKPGRIALNGGWLNGSWTDAFYRAIWGSTHLHTTPIAFQKPFIGTLNAESPKAWRMSPPGDAQVALRGLDGADLLAEARAAIAARPCLSADDGSRLLVALPKATNVRWSLKGLTRLLYVDEVVIADVIHVGIWDARPRELPNWSVVLNNDTPVGLIDRSTGVRIDKVESTRMLPGALVVTTQHVPYWLERRLLHACVDAWLSQSDPSWSLAEGMGQPEALFKPAAMASVFWELAGSEQPSRLEALASLDAELGGKPNPLAFMFDEEHDGIVRGSSPLLVVGCWQFEPTTNKLVNTLSGQCLRFRERLNIADTQNQPAARGGRIWLFRYEDGATEYPLVVISNVLGGASGSLRFGWTVDHERSKTLWQLSEGRQDPPPFGLWQRVDACAGDALMCWPEFEETGPRPEHVTSAGGWFNGEWSPAIRLRRAGRPAKVSEADPPLQPFLSEVSAPAHSWRFVHAQKAVANASLAHLQHLERNHLYLPAEAELTGFELNVPHLRRDDDQAVMFPAGLASSVFRGEDYMPNPTFLYADEDLFFSLRGDEFGGWGSLSSSWSFKLASLFRIGLRHLDRFDESRPDDIPTTYFVTTAAARQTPSPELTQRVTVALIEGWLAWTGASMRLLDDAIHLEKLRKSARLPQQMPSLDQSGIDLGRKSQVRVEGLYVGGQFNASASTTAWLEIKSVAGTA